MVHHSATHTSAGRIPDTASPSTFSPAPARGRPGTLHPRPARTGWWLLLLVGLIGWSGGARATAMLDPPVMFIGDSNCGANGYTCPVYNNEVNGIGTSSLTITENGHGQPTLANPLLLILGIPNKSNGSLSLPDITLSTGTGIAGGPNVYPTTGLPKWDSSTGYAGNWTGSPNSVYDFIGLLGHAVNSENWTNWTGAESAVNGSTATNFGIGVYSLTNTGMSGDKSVTVNFASALPLGTFAIAYGCADGGTDANNGGICTSGNVFGTPFTESAMVTNGDKVPPQSIPDPGTLVLLATSLGTLKATRRRARTKGNSSR